jgi:hypothetical protein
MEFFILARKPETALLIESFSGSFDCATHQRF